MSILLSINFDFEFSLHQSSFLQHTLNHFCLFYKCAICHLLLKLNTQGSNKSLLFIKFAKSLILSGAKMVQFQPFVLEFMQRDKDPCEKKFRTEKEPQ